jgi:hypothetical protein
MVTAPPEASPADGNEETAWGIYPQVGRSHYAVFDFMGNPGFDCGTALTFVLEQNHGGGHLIGRCRFSVTSAPPARSRRVFSRSH